MSWRTWQQTPSITNATAKYVLWKMFETGRDAESIINEEGLWEIKDLVYISNICDKVIRDNPEAVYGK